MPGKSTSVRLLIVDDDDELRQTLAMRFRRLGMTVIECNSGDAALTHARQYSFDVALIDLHMPKMSGLELLPKLKEIHPEMETLLLTGHASIESAIQAMKHGAYDYLTKPFSLPELEVHIYKAFEKVKLARREKQWVHQLDYESTQYKLIGSSTSMKRIAQMVQKVAPTDATVLIRGASGTGKEVIARALHYNSSRKDRPMVTINCAALQETLLESELFGHEKGSFTGATHAKPGLVEMAEGGTLFIDEIAEMAPGLQAKLLRVLENGHYRRVGGTVEFLADVRILAATNRPLETEMKEGRFREDLYYRLNVVTIELPPLSARREDIPDLVEHFLNTRKVGGVRYQISPEALNAMTHYDWPGNIRELANVLERAQILAENHQITLDDLPESLIDRTSVWQNTGSGPSNPKNLAEVEKRHVIEILKEEGGNKAHAARVLGISRRALYRLIKKHNLDT